MKFTSGLNHSKLFYFHFCVSLLMDSDPELEIEKDKDSGMSSMGESKDETPERRTGEVSCTLL